LLIGVVVSVAVSLSGCDESQSVANPTTGSTVAATQEAAVAQPTAVAQATATVEAAIAQPTAVAQATAEAVSLLKLPPIAFHADHDGSLDVYVMNADGSNLVKLTDDTTISGCFPAWVPRSP